MPIRPNKFLEWEPTERQKSDRSEKRIAKKTGGHVQPGSGMFRSRPEDVISRDFLFQHKRTIKHGFRVGHKLLTDLWKNAIREKRLPVLVIEFDRGEEESEEFYVLREEDFLLFVELIEKYRRELRG